MQRVLVIDDDEELCALIQEYLEPEGFHVEAVFEGEQGLVRALSGEHVLLILDVMLPGMNGLELLRSLRAKSDMPVLLLTARGGEVDRVVGLEMGSDDYLAKPFNPRELVARIHAILRRLSHAPRTRAGAERLQLGDIELDPATRSVLLGDQPIDLTAVEFSILELLLRDAGRIVTRERILSSALGRSLTPFDRSVDMHISRLRRKLGDEKGNRIKTVRSAGYLYARREGGAEGGNA